MKKGIQAVVAGNSLSKEEAKRIMNLMLSGEATHAQIASFLTALRMKGETLDEIIGCASVLKEKAEHIHPKTERFIDIVGTGGDGINTFNISTTSAFVIAGAGLAVAKHGNRAISSKSGAGDVLESLGVNIMSEPEQVEKAVDQVGIGFMFAQLFHKSMKNVGQARSEMGIRSIFNILGPLSNPSGAKNMLLGLYNYDLTDIIAHAILEMGVERALVVCGKDGMDEISTVTETIVSEVKDNKVNTYIITPEEFGFSRATPEELRGGDGSVNATITREILGGKKGPKRDIVLLNAGAGLYAGGVANSIQDGIKMAEESIDSGRALEKLDALVTFSNK